MKNTIIYLLAFPGTGKLTIAKELAKISEFKIVDSHRVNNVLFDLIGADGMGSLPDEIWESTRIIRNVVIDTITKLSPSEMSFIFTNDLREGKETDKILFNNVKELAQKRKARFLTCLLKIEEDELVRRIQSPERKLFPKSIDPKFAVKNVRESEIFKPKNCDVKELYVSKLSASEVAKEIFKELSIVFPKSNV